MKTLLLTLSFILVSSCDLVNQETPNHYVKDKPVCYSTNSHINTVGSNHNGFERYTRVCKYTLGNVSYCSRSKTGNSSGTELTIPCSYFDAVKEQYEKQSVIDYMKRRGK